MNDIFVVIWDKDGNNFNNIVFFEFWKWYFLLKWKKNVKSYNVIIMWNLSKW